MSIAVTQPSDLQGRGKSVFGIASVPLTFSGSYVAHGDTLNLAGMVPSTQVPFFVAIVGLDAAGYLAAYVPGTDITSGKVKILEDAGSAGAFAELAAGSYPAGITGATVFAVVFYKPSI